MRLLGIIPMIMACCAAWLWGHSTREPLERLDIVAWLSTHEKEDLPSLSDDPYDRNIRGNSLSEWRVVRNPRPTMIEMLIVSREEYDSTKSALGLSEGVLAYSVPGRPCRIVIPSDDIEIHALPEGVGGAFFGYQAGAHISHEMLHCFRGRWHPQATGPFSSGGK